MVDNLFLSLSERLLGGCDMYTLGPAISFDRDGGENHAFSLSGWLVLIPFSRETAKGNLSRSATKGLDNG
jgi:hypothetical protein